mgnify:CR=1 FL=1
MTVLARLTLAAAVAAATVAVLAGTYVEVLDRALTLGGGNRWQILCDPDAAADRRELSLCGAYVDTDFRAPVS